MSEEDFVEPFLYVEMVSCLSFNSGIFFFFLYSFFCFFLNSFPTINTDKRLQGEEIRSCTK